MAQAIYASPVQPARASGLLSFDVGIAANLVKVDTHAGYWVHSIPSGSNFIHSGYAAVPRLVVSKGFGAGTVSASYAKVSGSSIKTWGAAVDVPIIRGTLATPELAVRGTYGTLSGEDVLKLKTYGIELFLSKGFGPLTPYAAIGRMRADSHGNVRIPTFAPIILSTRSDINRYTAGLRLSLFIPKFVIEATQAEQRSYAAKVSVGF